MKIILKKNGEIFSEKGENITHLIKNTLSSVEQKSIVPEEPFITWKQIDEVTGWDSPSHKLFYYDNAWSNNTITFVSNPQSYSWIDVAN